MREGAPPGRLTKAEVKEWAERSRTVGMRDSLDWIALIGTRLLTGLPLLPLWPVGLITTAIGGVLLGVTNDRFGVLIDLVWLPLFKILKRLSILWYDFRWLRPLLILPGWMVAVVASVFLTLAPGGSQNRKYWLFTLVDDWPLTALVEAVPKDVATWEVAIAWRDALPGLPPFPEISNRPE